MADDDDSKGAEGAPSAAKDTGSDAQPAKGKGDSAKAAKDKGAAKGKGKDAGKQAAAKGKGAGKQGGAAAADDAQLPSVANHPRAGAQVGRAKSWGGLIGFGLAALLSGRAGVPLPDLLLRALAGGVVGYVLTWACAVALWRHLVIAELRAVRVQRAAVLAKLAAAATTPGEPGAAPSPRS